MEKTNRKEQVLDWVTPIVRIAHRTARAYGFDVSVALNGLGHLPRYFADFISFARKTATNDTGIPLGVPFPCYDSSAKSGTATGHYFHQDLLVAQLIHERSPERHVDIGSRVDGFVAHVAAFRNIEVLDIRPEPGCVRNVTFKQVDVTNLPEEYRHYTDSLSSLHAIEHFGLGRYGDELDPLGHVRGLESMHALLRPKGVLYLSLPLGPCRVEFNAHRVLSIPYLRALFDGRFRTRSFSYVDDMGALHVDQSIESGEAERNYGCNYGCGIFELEKI